MTYEVRNPVSGLVHAYKTLIIGSLIPIYTNNKINLHRSSSTQEDNTLSHH